MSRQRWPLTATAILAALAILSAATILLVGGCGGKTASPVELTGKDNGSDQTLSVGQELVISLESNMTTGYRWDLDGELPAQLEQQGEPEYQSESNLAGAGGTETWAFKATSAGNGTLKMKYWRSFEPTAEPARTFEVNVSVK